MALVHVLAVTVGWPEGDPEEGEENLTTVDLTVDGLHVRMGYAQSEIASSSDVEDLLTVDADAIQDPLKQHVSPFPTPTGGTSTPSLVPADFNI